MHAVIPELLWIGPAGWVRSQRSTAQRGGRDQTFAEPGMPADIEPGSASLVAAGIAAVVDLAAEEPPLVLPRDVIYCRLPLYDGEGNDPALLDVAVQTVASLLAARIATLVVCGGGMSRSPAVAAAAIAQVEGIDPAAALRRIAAAGPHDVSPALWADIERLGR